MRASDYWSIPDGARTSGFKWTLLTAVVCCCIAALPGKAADAVATTTAPPAIAATPPPAATAQQHQPIRKQPVLDQRIALMSAELALDERQQAELRRILINQRMQVMRLWNDTSVPAASRVGATRVISEQTGNQIRAMLNEEQKAKYNQPRKPRDATADPGARSVEDWMSATSRN